jgi:hypothetical protein
MTQENKEPEVPTGGSGGGKDEGGRTAHAAGSESDEGNAMKAVRAEKAEFKRLLDEANAKLAKVEAEKAATDEKLLVEQGKWETLANQRGEQLAAASATIESLTSELAAAKAQISEYETTIQAEVASVLDGIKDPKARAIAEDLVSGKAPAEARALLTKHNASLAAKTLTGGYDPPTREFGKPTQKTSASVTDDEMAAWRRSRG